MESIQSYSFGDLSRFDGAEVIVESEEYPREVVAIAPEPQDRRDGWTTDQENFWRSYVKEMAWGVVNATIEERVVTRAWVVFDPSRDQSEEITLEVLS